MLGTHTRREIVPLFPRFHIVAVSMERLQVRNARIVVVAIDMVHLDAVVMLEEQPAVSTATLLRFEQLGQSWIDTRVAALSTTPVHPIAIIRTAAALDFDMPGNRHCTVSVKMTGFSIRGRGGKDQTAV